MGSSTPLLPYTAALYTNSFCLQAAAMAEQMRRAGLLLEASGSVTRPFAPSNLYIVLPS